MKPLDWLLIILATPFILLHVVQFGFLFVNLDKVRKVTIRPAFFIPYLMIMVVLYRVWG